jgi:hypothetical protein
LIVDDLLVLGPIFVSPGGAYVTVPSLFDPGHPFIENLCVSLRLAGFALNFNVQRPFPSFSPLALFELFALFSDPEHYQVDPHGELANSLRVTLKDTWFVLPEAVLPLFPGSEGIVGRNVEFTMNLADFIGAVQQFMDIVKPAVLGTLEALRDGADDAQSIAERLQEIAGQAAAGDWRSLIALAPAPMRQLALGASFGGFTANAWLLLMDRDEARQQLRRRGKPAKARPRPKALKPGHDMSTSTLRSIGFKLPSRPGQPPLHDASDPAHNVMAGEAFAWVDTALMNAIDPPDDGGVVIVGAEVRVTEALRQRFFGWLASDGSFGFASQAGLDLLTLQVAGLEVPLPLAIMGRLLLAGSAKAGGVVRADVSANWDMLPGLVNLKIGTPQAPASWTLRSDGRFRLQGDAVVAIAGNTCRIDGTADVADSHCHVNGTLVMGEPEHLAVELAASGRFGPGPRFELAGNGQATLMGMALADVEGRADERGLAVAARLAVPQWKLPGGDSVPIEVDLRLEGSARWQGSQPNLRLGGTGRLALFGAAIASGRCGVESRRNKFNKTEMLTWIEGALRWHGREWLNARIELANDRLAVRGRTTLDFDITPPGSPMGLLLVLNLDASIALGLPGGGLEALAAYGDWLIGVRVEGPGHDRHIVPIAVGRMPALTRSELPQVLIHFPGFALPKLDAALDLPLPKLVLGEPKVIKVPDAVTFTLPELRPISDTKITTFFDSLLSALTLGQLEEFTFMTGVAYDDDEDDSTPTIDLGWSPDITVPTVLAVDWDGDAQLPLPFDAVPGFTLVLDWDATTKQFVILGELKPPPPKVHVEYDPEGIDIVGEFVLILNDTDCVMDLTGWVIHDAATRRRSYTFPSRTLAPGEQIRLWSKAGADDAHNLYWGRKQAVWNNSGDTAVLIDARGREMVRTSFGR